MLDSPAAKKAALPLATSVAGAQQRLAEEEEAFRLRKTVKKAEKIKVSASQQEQAKREQEAKEAKKAQKAKAKEEAGDKGLLGFLSFDRKKDGKDDAAAKEEKNRIDLALANKKADDAIRKYAGTPLKVGGLAGTAEKGLATGIGKVLDAGNTGDDIASAAGAIATSTAGVATSLMNTFREFKLYANTSGAERTVHLKKAMEALGGAVGNLVNLTKGSLNVAEHAGALEAGSAGAHPWHRRRRADAAGGNEPAALGDEPPVQAAEGPGALKKQVEAGDPRRRRCTPWCPASSPATWSRWARASPGSRSTSPRSPATA